ncbi:MAG TPA: PAS domain-containing protein [Caulobacteraceae bacterium]|nr:PAS domain-containing protein [Caulobacteraceae bacterium]
MNTQLGAPTTALRAHEELFSYWAGLRRRGALPARRDLDPGRIKRLLPTVSLTQVVGEPRDYRLRLAGTGLYGIYGGEITGRKLEDVYNTAAADYWREELDRVVEEGRPRAGHHSMAWRGAAHMTLLWLRLPLATNGKDVDVILGYDAVLAPRGDMLSGIRAA